MKNKILTSALSLALAVTMPLGALAADTARTERVPLRDAESYPSEIYDADRGTAPKASADEERAPSIVIIDKKTGEPLTGWVTHFRLIDVIRLRIKDAAKVAEKVIMNVLFCMLLFFETLVIASGLQLIAAVFLYIRVNRERSDGEGEDRTACRSVSFDDGG